MSRKKLDTFIRKLDKLAGASGVRIGFITLDDKKLHICSCRGIDPDDPLIKEHLKTLYCTLDSTFNPEKE